MMFFNNTTSTIESKKINDRLIKKSYFCNKKFYDEKHLCLFIVCWGY